MEKHVTKDIEDLLNDEDYDWVETFNRMQFEEFKDVNIVNLDSLNTPKQIKRLIKNQILSSQKLCQNPAELINKIKL